MHYAELNKAWAELTQPGAPFEITEVVVDGGPVRAFRNAPPSVRALWQSTAAFGPRDYLVYYDERITYDEAHRLVASTANWMLAQGLKPGDRVAVAMRNYPEWMLIYWACACVGVAVVGMNAWWTSAEMAFGISDADPKVLFADAERIARLDEQPGMLGTATLVAVRAPTPEGATPWSEVAATGGPLPDVAVDPDADLCIFYTSGTTGFPKGAQLTHRSCVNNLMNMMFAGQVQTLATQRGAGVTPDPNAPVPIPVTLITTPLFHVTANNCAAYGTTAGGGKMVLMHKWDAGEALKLIERERVSSVSGVPVMSRELVTHPDFSKHDTSSLLSVGGGGAQLQPDLVAKIDQAVATARPNTGYGMTETSGIITSISGDFFVDKPASCGRAMPTFETRVVGDDGEPLAPNQPGELWVRGASVIKGYINRPEATAESITDGWIWSCAAARISTAPRSKPRSTSMPQSPNAASSASPTPGLARKSVPPSCCARARPSTPRPCVRTALGSSHATRRPATSGSSTPSCPATPTASSSSANSAKPWQLRTPAKRVLLPLREKDFFTPAGAQAGSGSTSRPRPTAGTPGPGRCGPGTR